MGGGTSGAVLASRITEDENKRVLLIEAGEDQAQNPDVNIPIMGEKVRGSELDWNFETVTQKYACKSHINRVRIKFNNFQNISMNIRFVRLLCGIVVKV